MKQVIINGPASALQVSITLEGSKSISNRLLIMQAFSAEHFPIDNLSPSDDTQTLQRLLYEQETFCDVGAAGTTMRFLTAYFSMQSGERILTGSARMQQRPIGILVDALRSLGADITYLGTEGFPPLRIIGKKLSGGHIKIRSDVSSQFISALLLSAPSMENGITLELTGKIASFPYIMMTLEMMRQCGISYSVNDQVICVLPGNYQAEVMKAESDWSAASYYFSLCALSESSVLRIRGLLPKSLQGDSVLPLIYQQLGVASHFEEDELILQQTGPVVQRLEYDFSDCPDLAQTVAVSCAALGVEGRFTGLESLRIKETDRTAALSNELKKFGVVFQEEEGAWVLRGKASADGAVIINTYEDHRMAMSFAPLAVLSFSLIIESPEVVKKSYPSFWSDLSSLGFSCSFS